MPKGFVLNSLRQTFLTQYSATVLELVFNPGVPRTRHCDQARKGDLYFDLSLSVLWLSTLAKKVNTRRKQDAVFMNLWLSR